MAQLRLGRARSGRAQSRRSIRSVERRFIRAGPSHLRDRPHHQGERRLLHGRLRLMALPHTSRRRIRGRACGIGNGAMRDVFVRELTRIAAQRPEVMLLTGDLGFGVLDDFAQRFPTQSLNVGVAEQNMTGLATGLALEGRIVFTYSLGNFPTLRCLEQIRNDACYHGASVKIVTVGGGMSYGAVGASHHATEDLAILCELPDTTVICPGDHWEVAQATRDIVDLPGVTYFRLDK